jgi:hypothetical protein
MAGSSFMPEVKERERGRPCFILLNTYEDIGLGQKHIIFNRPDRSGIEQAQELAHALRKFRVRVRVA